MIPNPNIRIALVVTNLNPNHITLLASTVLTCAFLHIQLISRKTFRCLALNNDRLVSHFRSNKTCRTYIFLAAIPPASRRVQVVLREVSDLRHFELVDGTEYGVVKVKSKGLGNECVLCFIGGVELLA